MVISNCGALATARVALSSLLIGAIGTAAGWCAEMWALCTEASALFDLRVKDESFSVELERTEVQKMASSKKRKPRERKEAAIADKTMTGECELRGRSKEIELWKEE